MDALEGDTELQLNELRELVDQVYGVRFNLEVVDLGSRDLAELCSPCGFRALSNPMGSSAVESMISEKAGTSQKRW